MSVLCLGTGDLIEKLPPEIVYKCWSLMAIPELIIYGSTCKFNQQQIRIYVDQKLRYAIQPFFKHPSEFLDILIQTDSIISGSFALAFMIPIEVDGWHPKDLDLYTEGKSAERIIRFLKKSGFVSVKSKGINATYFETPDIKSIITYSHTETKRQIDLIISATTAAESPIFRFHSTMLMNWISGNALFSAYPNLTSSKRGLLNPITFIAPDLPPAHVVKCLQKYADRGISLRLRPTAWKDDKHICKQSMICPQTSRSTRDSGCFRYTFRSSEEWGFLGTGYDHAVSSARNKTVIWYLGGFTCSGEENPMRPFASLRPDV